MRRTPAVLLGVTGQTLTLRFPQGRPTSATFAVIRAYAFDDAVPEFSGSATLDPVSTTTTAAAGPSQPDPQLLLLTSFASVQTQRKYLLSLNAVQEWVDLVEIAPAYVRVRNPLQYDYASGASFASATLTLAIDDAWVAQTSKLSDLSDTFPDYRVKWTIVFNGQTVVIYSFFDVVRAQVRNHVEIDDINTRAPGLADSLPVEYRAEDGRPLIDAAWASVRAHLQAGNIAVDAIREDEVLDEMTVLRALRLLAEGGWHPPDIDALSYVQLTTSNYERFFEQHFAASLKHRLDYQLGPLIVSPTGYVVPGREPFFVK